MRLTSIAIAVALLVATPAFAVVKHPRSKPAPPSFDACEALSVERGTSVLQGGNASNPYVQYNNFMKQCLAGQIPLSK